MMQSEGADLGRALSRLDRRRPGGPGA
jgi:hypothetical protein